MKFQIIVKDNGKLFLIQSFICLFKAMESIKRWEESGFSAELF